ncbi:hypothetical protein QIA23_05925 (plasmid) [Borreliella lanei]|uniref:hypothetical protein n=1 Tax=Borreliella lanei TaxID=373540 RepID=UPI003AEF7AB3
MSAKSVIRSDVYRVLGDLNLSILRYMGGMNSGYFRLKRENEYKRYLNKAKNIFPGGLFYKIAIERNNLDELP